jgi:hypothetical protein
MITRIIVLFVGLFAASSLFSQTEVGLFGGVANYGGELAPSRLTVSELNAAGGVFIRSNLGRHFAVRGGFTIGRLSGDDANQSSPDLLERNLSFRNDVFEFAFTGEFNLVPMERNNSVIPYVFLGVSAFYHNPKAFYDGRWIELQPLGTEGQGTSAFPDRRPYSLTQIAIPMGAGIKFRLNDNTILALEGGLRRTFTDYLDDASSTYGVKEVLLQEKGALAAALSDRAGERTGEPVNRTAASVRGNPLVDDYFAFMGATLSFGMGGGKRGQIGGRYGCPTNF